jgi:hypothetical protein
MLYIALESNHIKALYLKKSLLGQYDTSFYEKTYQMDFMDGGEVSNPDLMASAIKESLAHISSQPVKEREIDLVLPQEAFQFTRTEIPPDIAQSALLPFIKEKARADLMVDVDMCAFDYLIHEIEGKKEAVFYALEFDMLQRFAEPLKLLDLEIRSVTPESLSYYTLFEKTVRKDKKENIFFVSYHKDHLVGYVYDSYGLLEKDKWVEPITESSSIEDILKKKADAFEEKGLKLNRLILSGEKSDDIRQDTFTKKVGVWTNPLKRIIPHFYDEYVKLFNSESDKVMPFLQYDVCTGACVFAFEHKDFSLVKKSGFFSGQGRKSSRSAPPRAAQTSGGGSRRGFQFPLKAVLVFIVSFAAALGLIFLVPWQNFASMNFNFAQAEPTPTPTPVPTEAPPSPTPTPAFVKEDLNLKVLNGVGEAGLAGDVKDFLQEQGYGEILTDNAEAFDYETTEIQVKEEVEGAGQVVADDLAENGVTDPEITTLDEEEAADIVIIIGEDYE